MNTKQEQSSAWVSSDGSYGEDDLMVFHPDSLTKEQWELMTTMRDNDRLPYVQAILEGDLETVVAMEMDYEEPVPVDGYYGEDRTPDYGPDTPNIREHN